MNYPQLDLKKAKGTEVVIHTNLGDLKIKLFDSLTPKTVKNFLELAKKNYYDGVVFHRVINDFMVQGGDPTGTGAGGTSIYGKRFEDEFSDELFNLRGALSMANAGPNTNGSQFFIVQKPSSDYSSRDLESAGWPSEIAKSYAVNGGTPHLDRRHTVFGHLADEASFEVLDKMADVAVDYNDRPYEPIIIESVTISEAKKKKVLKASEDVFRKHEVKIGDIFDAEVVGIQPYGAFVKFGEDDKKGLVHISEIQSGFVKDIHEVAEIGQKLKVQVIDFDEYSGKISLSVRSLEEEPELHKAHRKHFATDNRENIGFESLSKEMATWVKDAESYLQAKD